ncbi:MAG: S8 family serine peptidase, partial [Pseudomonadota bacterium]|nr:S8 family serine peptidase [Pseudomonadota bacterium]
MKAKFNKTTQALLLCSTFAGTALAADKVSLDTDSSERFIVTLKSDSLKMGLPVTADAQQQQAFKLNKLQSLASSVTSQAIHVLPSTNSVALKLTQAEREQLLNRSDVQSVEVDPKRYLLAESTPYGIGMVQADQLSDNLTGNRKVCIMDTGYQLGHPDLPSNGITGNDGYGNNDTGNWYNDGNGHGTHVAGTIAAIGGNGQGVVGVNPSNQLGLHIVKVFNDQGRWAYGSDLIRAIEQCQQAGANVTSMSLGGSG